MAGHSQGFTDVVHWDMELFVHIRRLSVQARLSGLGICLTALLSVVVLTSKEAGSSPVREVERLRVEAHALYTSKRYAEAVDTFTKALAYQKPTYEFELLLYRGGAYGQLNQMELALTDINRAITIRPNSPLGYVQRATVYSKLNQDSLALQDINYAIQLEPTRGDSYWMRGSILKGFNLLDEALVDFSKAIELGVTNPKIYQERGYVFEQLGQYQKALFNYNLALETEPSDPIGLLRRGWIYQCLGNFDKAIKDFDLILSQNPDDEEARVQRANVYLLTGQFELALADYQYAEAHGFTNEYLPIGLSYVYYRLGNPAKAIEVNERAFQSQDVAIKTSAYFQQGIFYLRQANLPAATRAMEEGILLTQESLTLTSLDMAIEDLKAMEPLEDRLRKPIWELLTQARTALASKARRDPQACQKSKI